MVDHFIVDRRVWWAFVGELSRQRRVYAPLREGEEVVYRLLQPTDEVRWDRLPTAVSARGVLLPQRETLFHFRTQDRQIRLEVPPPEPASLILGLAPCDARAWCVLDRIFATPEWTDIYYVTRRQQTAIVSVACLHPQATCFCTQVGGDPFGREGSDLFVVDLGEQYLVEALTPTGRELVSNVSWPLATPQHRAQAEQLAAQARGRLPAPAQPLAFAQGELSRQLLEAPLWASLASRCLGCGICGYICPTCRCFDIVDEERCPGCGERVRNWDSCQFACYTLEASGHNPRPSRRERFRQRILDKFVYLPVQANVLGCVGCGRCIRACPVNIDVREVVDEIRSL